jgi:hypothetical protein
MRATREDPFIKLFLSVYDNGAWADADLVKPGAVERRSAAIDQVATRRSDGKTLAIEHTIIEPFLHEKADFAEFSKANFLSIEKDQSLPVPGLWFEVFVPVGLLRDQSPAVRGAMVQSIHAWLKANRSNLVEGMAEHSCAITGAAGNVPTSIQLTVRVVRLRSAVIAETGIVHIRRQQTSNSLSDVIEKALNRKLPKLIHSAADKHILLLERQHMNLLPKSILAEIDRQRESFPELANVSEIWIIETILYDTAFGGTYLRFELYEKGDLVQSYDFQDGKLLTKFENGAAEIVNPVV